MWIYLSVTSQCYQCITNRQLFNGVRFLTRRQSEEACVHIMIAPRRNNIMNNDMYLTHWGLMRHICVGKLYHHWLKPWLVACSATTHYLNQWWCIVNDTLKNIFKWNFIWNRRVFIPYIRSFIWCILDIPNDIEVLCWSHYFPTLCGTSLRISAQYQCASFVVVLGVRRRIKVVLWPLFHSVASQARRPPYDYPSINAVISGIWVKYNCTQPKQNTEKRNLCIYSMKRIVCFRN